MARPLHPDPPLSDGVVTLRPGRADDADHAVPALRDPEIPRWTRVPKDYTAAHWQAFLDGTATPGELSFVIADRDDALLGVIGLHSLEGEPLVPEIGYWIARDARGRGLASRAVRLLTAWVRAELGARTVEILVHPENRASRRAAERAGYADTGERRPAPRGGLPEGPYVVLAASAP